MIAHLCGTLDSKRENSIVIDVNGAGYEVFLTPSALLSLPNDSPKIKLYIIESMAMYGGATTLYGFLSEEEKEVFSLLKDEVPGTGAKKALEYLDKVAKAIGDFRRCIVNKDSSTLTGIFGFTKKTADKLITSLKDKAGLIQLPSKERLGTRVSEGVRAEAISGLIALGYRDSQAREAVDRAMETAQDNRTVEEVIKLSLRQL